MKTILQRVTEARVEVDGKVAGRCGPGLMILVCAMPGDDTARVDRLARRVAKLRIFRDEAGRMNRSLLDVGGSALVVSQFTLAADTSSGTRPGFSRAAPPEEGRAFYEHFVETLRDEGVEVGTGVFGAEMQVHLVNDGPVTIPFEG